MKCMNCGNELPEGAVFCARCGTSVNAQPQQAYHPAPDTVQKKKSIFPIVIIIALLVVILALCALIVGYMVFSGTQTFQQQVAVETVAPTMEPTEVPVQTVAPQETPIPTQQPAPPAPPPHGYGRRDGYYILPTDTVRITERDLMGRSKDEVAFIRNEIYARHGYIFKTEPYKTYFASQPWYYPNVNFSENMFNSIEKANKELIVAYEQRMGWR